MKIAVCGSQNTGKSTFIKDFITKWPMYKQPEKSYRDFLKEKNIKINTEGNQESQNLILNALIDQAMAYPREENTFLIYDRCPLDNLAYTFWLNFYKPDKVSEKFLRTTVDLVKNSLKFFDIIFFTPISASSPIPYLDNKNNPHRSLDATFREEINNILQGFLISYSKNDGRVFPVQDSPAFIEIIGNQEERIELASLYINEKGKAFEEQESLLIDSIHNIPEEYQNSNLLA